jgi:hypothetical protein
MYGIGQAVRVDRTTVNTLDPFFHAPEVLMPMINLDDQVLAAIEERTCPRCGVSAPLRNAFGLRPPRVPRHQQHNSLIPLMEAGTISSGDKLIWHRKNLDHTHYAAVTAEGLIQLGDGSLHYTPDKAASSLAGYPIYAWRQWRRISDGLRLIDLRQ